MKAIKLTSLVFVVHAFVSAGSAGAQVPQAVESQDDGARPRRSGVLFLPTLGIHSFQNESASSYDPGLRLGALVGGRINEFLSINGQAALDVLNVDVPAGVDVTAFQLHAAFSPLLHARAENLEFVFGPKLGVFAMSAALTDGVDSVDTSIRGWLAGFNLGLFGPVNDTLSMGGLLSFDFENATSICLEVNGIEDCDEVESDTSAKVLGVGVALLM